jgi:hypothetical protein
LQYECHCVDFQWWYQHDYVANFLHASAIV